MNLDQEKHPDIAEYKYFVAGLKIGEEDYTVRSVIAVQPNGEQYYDHKLSKIEKGKLIDSLSGTNPGFNQVESLNPDYKDTKLILLLQTNVSKVVDENGEPMVVYYGPDADFNEFNPNAESRRGGV